MKSLLVIGYTFPPQLNPESLLLSRTLGALVRLGWQATVLTIMPECSLDPMDSSLLTNVPASVEVVRAPSLERLLFSNAGPRKLFSRSLLLMGLPEVKFAWYFSALRAAQRLARGTRFDAILSWACYHTSNVVGLGLKRVMQLPWVAHFSDPWVDNPYFRSAPLQRWVCRRMEKAVIREADAVVFVTREAADVVMRKYPPPWRERIHVIPHGFDRELLGGIRLGPMHGGPLHLVYTGSFYQRMRTPLGLLEGLRLLGQDRPLQGQLKVTLIGPNAELYRPAAEEMGLLDVVKFHSLLPFTQTLQAAAEADVLLLIDGSSRAGGLFLPSKLVDYLMFRKPILGLTPEPGASATLLRRLGCPVVPPDEPPAIAHALSQLLALSRSGQLAVPPSFDRVAQEYDIQFTTRLLHGVLDHCG